MCGFAGYVGWRGEREAGVEALRRMTNRLLHRGPDSCGYFVDEGVGIGFRRLSIIDVEGGDQPIYNEDGRLALFCNGEIFNHRELRQELERKGHRFRTRSDVEVIVHLYEEEGEEFLSRLNGQFAFVIYDRERKELFGARDQFGICPFYYSERGEEVIFGSEIKAMLEHPGVRREVDLTGLDQVLTFPGLVSPRTMFKGIESLRSGHWLRVRGGEARTEEYWDLEYPREGEIWYEEEERSYVEGVRELLEESVRRRLEAEVEVGFYLSGGLDSSLIAALIEKVGGGKRRHSFSVTFKEQEISEGKYQRMMAERVKSIHHELVFDWPEIADRLRAMIFHAECPAKESYNTCSMALSQSAKENGVKVILTGEGSDELFAGYVGYRFDQSGMRNSKKTNLERILEEEIRERLWGDKDLFYESNFFEFREVRAALYSDLAREKYADFDCVNFPPINKEKLRQRHPIHQRSYLDFKLRLADHLISDHGDRMSLANSVEGRYPFLDIRLIEYLTRTPPWIKLNNLIEKYILKKAAEPFLPAEIIQREKFGFHAPGSPCLLRQNIEWINDTLSYDRIKRDGYFNPDVVERLKTQYSMEGFKLNLPFETDLLMVALTFGVFLDVFELPRLN